ncbi:MAG: UDP-N-acetyl glucosamine 2-epimerase, partial [Actinomycetota bacterium]
MKVASVVGARPQFIKAAPVTTALQARGIDEFLVHTGQHYDERMSEVFFTELGIRPPDVNLAVGSGSHGAQTASMLEGIERVLLERDPAGVLVYGDTNSTLAGALAAVKLGIPIAHVEAGLRSFNRQMPEEHNRVLTDHMADLLFCPTPTAVDNLAREGVSDGVFEVGDTMYDAVLRFRDLALGRGDALARIGLQGGRFFLCTV